MIDLIFVGDRCNDHSPSSGYDQVCQLIPEAGWLSGRALEAGRIEWHREPRPGSEPRLFHVIYGDCSGKGVVQILRQRYPHARIVSSAHQPVVRLRDDGPALAALRASDAIITVSQIQADELRALDFAVPIHAIPHGVWTRVFHPAREDGEGRRRDGVLLVGSFLRDWEAARAVAAGLSRAGVRALALGAGARKNLAVDDPALEVSPRVSEEQLAQLYDRSVALFLPFLEATASNALLEAMAAGCPIVCPRLPSLIDEYIGDEIDAFTPGDHDAAIARLLTYARDPAARAARSRVLRARGDAFDWSRLVSLHVEAYQELAAPSRVQVARSITVPPAPRLRWLRSLVGDNGPHDGPHDGPYDRSFDRAELVEAAVAASTQLVPVRVIEACARLARRTTREVALRVRALPLDPDLPPTPTGASSSKSTRVSEAVILGIAGQLGDLIAYRDEKAGALVQDVFPDPLERASPSNASYEISLDLHTEIGFRRGDAAWRPYEASPDFLLLLCLRAAARSDALTRVVAADELLARLSAELRAALALPRFELRAPYSFTRAGDHSRPWSPPVPLVHDEGRIALDLACGVRAIDPEAERALQALRLAAADPALGECFALEAGDLLIIDNRRALHGRSAFVACGDGTDRWIQRLYVRQRSTSSGAADQHEPAEIRERQRTTILRL